MRIAFYPTLAPVGTPSAVVDIEPMPLSDVAMFATMRHIATGDRCAVVIGSRREPVVMLMGSIE